MPTGQNIAARRDFWEAYVQRFDEVQQASMALVVDHPTFGPMLAAMTADDLEQQQAHSKRMMHAALLEDGWEAYEADLRIQGSMYAQMGIDFSAWYPILRVTQEILVPTLVQLLPSSRAASAVLAMQAYFDRAMSLLAASYLETKQHLVDDQRRLAEARAEALVHSEAQAREQKQLLDLVLDSVAEGVVVYDARMQPLLTNRSAIRILRSDQPGGDADVTGMRRFFHTDGVTPLSEAEQPQRRALAGEAIDDYEVMMRDGDEDPGVRISVNARPLHDDQGRRFGAVISVRDVTEVKRIEQLRKRSAELEEQNQRVREASRLKSEFLANMSHELRTPLNAIIGFSELLHAGEVPFGSEEYQEFLGDILTSGRHLLKLINDVLDLAKVEAGKLEFHSEEVDLTATLTQVAHLLRGKAIEQQVQVTVQVDPSIGPIVTDPSRLVQVLYNYLSNALKFTPRQGTVTVRALPEGLSAFRIEVEDSGIGIRPEDLPRLFIEFQQLDAGAARHHGGTGLGLALTRRLVEAQGGSVGVRSEVGKGTTFHAVMPRKAIVGTPLPEMRAIPCAKPDAPWVLVIEDDPVEQEAIVAVVTGAGCSVQTAATVAQALDRCAEKRFDAVTLDLLLPDGSGFDILNAVRGGTLNRDTPVVVVSVLSDNGGLHGYAVRDWLPKPVAPDTLLMALHRALPLRPLAGPILVIDDDGPSLRLMEATLAQLGHEAILRSDARAALADVDREALHAIVLDLVMPGMDGFGFLEQFRGKAAYGRVPVIIWTSKDLSGDERTLLGRSTQGLLTKGDGGALLDELRRVLAGDTEGSSRDPSEVP
jgi:signal transduction histidine kinase/CheY-like chemotaxis protein